MTHAAYYLNADTRCFHQSFKEAIRRRGLPRKLYTHQGGPFINDHTRVICANLGVRLLHAKPYHAWSKGKIERFFHTVQQDLEATLRLAGQQVASLEELNGRLADWLQTVYHVRRPEEGVKKFILGLEWHVKPRVIKGPPRAVMKAYGSGRFRRAGHL